MLRGKHKWLLCALMGCILVQGCAAGGVGTPSMANIDNVVAGTLSPAERKAAIEELQAPPAGSGEAKSIPLVKATTANTAN